MDMSILGNEVIDMSFKITLKEHLILSLMATLIILALLKPLDQSLEYMFSSGVLPRATGNELINFYIFLAISALILTIIHELFHAAVFKSYGGKVKIGFKFAFAYTQEISELALSRIQFLCVLMSPLIIISVATMLMPIWLGTIVFVMNLAGSVGDLYMAFYLCKQKSDSKYIDNKFGFTVEEKQEKINIR